ncbi:hypothetical protein Voc01_089230 [Virgisporangium ochraceum]|uniref:Uncharacterized protein n=1 Tax=Virgisporangium ochraceum TaxID=65505 RepID=A0A8J4EGS0_9ACTN|nr:hypothetical protein Voc01_089230 [Virgisporangium ochraceum]
MSGETTGTAESEVDDRAPESAEADEPAQPEAVGKDPAGEGTGSRRPVAVLAMVSVTLLVAAVVFGVLFARERSQRQRAERDLAAQTALAAQRATDLDAVRAQRAEIERKLATAEAQLLSPEAKAAINACVKSYAVLEKTIEDAGRTGYGSGSSVTVLPAGAAPGKLCTAAEPYLAKLA